jgi:Flp pilus assembly protein TadG
MTRHRAVRQAGQSLTELALALPILTGLLALTLQGGVILSDQIGMAHVADEGAQWAAQNPTSATTGDAGTVARHVYQQLCGQGVATGQTSSTSPTKFCRSSAPVVHVTSRATPTSAVFPSPTGAVLAANNCKNWDPSASPGTITTAQGGQVQFSVSLVNVSGGNGQPDPLVALAAGNLPPGLTPGVPAFNPSSISPGSTAILNFTTSTSTPPGTYSISVTGTDQCNNGAAGGGPAVVTLNVTGTPVSPPTANPVQPSVISTSVSSFVQSSGGVTTLIGTNFASGATVQIGGTAASLVTFLSSTSLIVTVPPGIPTGTYNITVTNPGGAAATLSNAITISLVAPSPTASPTASSSPGGGVTTACAPGSGNYEYVIQVTWTEPLYIPWLTQALQLTATQYAACQ